MLPPLALLTDFGLSDPYVAQMKAVFLSQCPDARIVDISHDITPFHYEQAGFFLEASRKHFPQGTVFVAVVDPGVGSPRSIVLLEKAGQSFLAPDNGLLSLVLSAPGVATAYSCPVGAEASHTFHGRDVFAPLAIRRLLGEPPEHLGIPVPISFLIQEDWARVEQDSQAQTLTARVLHIDRFGNTVLNLSAKDWKTSLFQAAGVQLRSLQASVSLRCVRVYSELQATEVGVLEGSQGFLELAANQISAAEILGLSCGDTVTLALSERA